ncbi:MAG: dipeptide transport system permease protein DppC [Amycolatopsis sp.]|uniref:ABC transporter permease n=1 Tax=Amycolatopsis sp. TaxID=37632 RepID=UPI00263A2A10|nr:ABC transporter permease [Amycolatopsis sp.]MCU1679942.1 dipeptide transport system permease protein DppC [Amycolatopsis sp.]
MIDDVVGPSALVTPSIPSARPGAWHAFRRHRLAVIALAVFVVVVLVAVLAPVLPVPDPNSQVLLDRLQGPSARHLLGTDELGRDQLARLLSGTRISLWAALQATVVGAVLGVPLGLLTGTVGGRVDSVLSRAFDAVQSIPALILAIAVVAVLGRQLTPAMVSIGVAFSPTFYRVSRAAASTVAGETYIEASRSMGQKTARIVVDHVLGNVAAALVVVTSTTFAFGILAEAALSYLGLGTQPPSASLGSMLTSAANLLNSAPQLTIEPGLVIVLVVLCVSLVSDAVQAMTSAGGDR